MKRLVRLAQKNQENDPEAVERLRASMIVGRIRKRYTVDQELAILRQQHRKPEDFAVYDAFVEQCKAEVDAELGL